MYDKSCPQCGREMPLSANFCGGCGYSFKNENKSEPKPKYDPSDFKSSVQGQYITKLDQLFYELKGKIDLALEDDQEYKKEFFLGEEELN